MEYYTKPSVGYSKLTCYSIVTNQHAFVYELVSIAYKEGFEQAVR